VSLFVSCLQAQQLDTDHRNGQGAFQPGIGSKSGEVRNYDSVG